MGKRMEFSVASPETRILDGASQEQSTESLVTDEKTAYEQLITPLESRMMRSIWRVVRHPEWAEDTLQDALAIIWKKLQYILRHPNPQALVLKICLNAAYDTLRKRKQLRKQDKSYDLQTFLDVSDDTAPSTWERKEIEDAVMKAISQLPRKQAAAVLMRVVQDCPYDAVAQVLGCSETTARIHVSRARARLSRCLAHLSSVSFKKEGSK
jgi:RNA polymerase sigma factor (sigma-70 family)